MADYNTSVYGQVMAQGYGQFMDVSIGLESCLSTSGSGIGVEMEPQHSRLKFRTDLTFGGFGGL